MNIVDTNIVNSITQSQQYATMKHSILEIYIDPKNSELLELYKTHAEKHNNSMLHNEYPNSGFDIFVPDDVIFDENHTTKMIDFQIKAQMWDYVSGADDNTQYIPTGYYLYPRSSISKTPLLLANNVGIIDSGYRDNLMGAFRCFLPPSKTQETSTYTVKKHTRLLQICNPTLSVIVAELLNSENELTVTSRNGGFGSTGLIGQTI